MEASSSIYKPVLEFVKVKLISGFATTFGFENKMNKIIKNKTWTNLFLKLKKKIWINDYFHRKVLIYYCELIYLGF